MKPTLIDTHCHLDFDRFEADFDAVLERAEDAGVSRMVTIGCAHDAETTTIARDLAARYPQKMRASVGVHPHDAEKADDATLAAVEAVASDPLVVGVGEMGLDYYYDSSPRERQREIFRVQIAIARRVGKPIIIHTRDAAEDTLQILRDEGARDVGGIIHCFSEDAAFAHAALELGFVSSFSGLVTFPRGTEAIREAARRQPLDALLIETDAPFLAPVPRRGKRNEPAYVAHTARAIAELRGISFEALVEATTANAERVYGWTPGALR